jgi:hypothetical protein
MLGNDPLHRSHDIKVEEAIEEADVPSKVTLRDPCVGPWMMRLQVFDNDRGFDDRLPVIDQDRKFSERPIALQLVHERLWIDHFERAGFELRPVGVERDQHLLGEGGKRVAE